MLSVKTFQVQDQGQRLRKDTALQLNSDLLVKEREEANQKAEELNEQVLDLENRNGRLIQRLKEIVKEKDTALQLNSDLLVKDREEANHKAEELNEQVLDLENRNGRLIQRLKEIVKEKDTASS